MGPLFWSRLRRAEKPAGVAAHCRTARFESLERRILLDAATHAVASLEDTSAENGANAPLSVSTLVDENDGDYSPGDFSLREALALAAQRPGDDIIRFEPGLRGGTITLEAVLGQLVIDSNVAIQGPGSEELTVDAAGAGRVLSVADGVTVGISGLAVTGGDVDWNNTDRPRSGGGIYNLGVLTITNTTISGNSARSSGGGISNGGTLTLANVTIADNSSSEGGGIYNEGPLTLTDPTISGNSAAVEGGGIYHAAGSLSVIGGTVSENSANYGGGIYNRDTMTVDGTAIVGNSADVPTQSTRAVLYSASGEANATATLNFAAGVSLDVNVDGGAAVIDINAAALGANESGVTVVFTAGATDTAVYDDANNTLTINYQDTITTLNTVLTNINALDEFSATLQTGATASVMSGAQTANQTTGIDSLTITATTDGPDFNDVQISIVTRAAQAAPTATYFADTKWLMITIDDNRALTLSGVDQAVDGLEQFSSVMNDNGTGRVIGSRADAKAIANTGISGYLNSAFSPGTHARATLDFLAGTALSIVGNGGISVIDINATAMGTRESNVVVSFMDDVWAGSEVAIYDSQAKTLVIHYAATLSTVDSLIGAIDDLREFSATLSSGDAGDTLSAATQQTGGGSAEATGVDSLKITALVAGADFNNLAVSVTTGAHITTPTAVYDATVNTLVITIDDNTALPLTAVDQAIDRLWEFSSVMNDSGTGRVIGWGDDAYAVANTATSGGNLLSDDVVLAIGGNRGYELFTFQQNASVNRLVSVINLVSDATGVAASQSAGLLTLNSLTYGRDATVSATVVSGAFEMTDANGDVTDRSRGTGPSVGLGGQSGGGIYNAGPLRIAEATIRGNSAGIDGGGIFNHHSGVLTLADTSIAENRAVADGGGVWNVGVMTLTGATFWGNSTDWGAGGGIFNSHTAIVDAATISQNSADYGGGIYNDGPLILTDPTISGNSAAVDGGGIYNDGPLILTDPTISGNSADYGGGGIYHAVGTLSLTGGTVSENSANYGGGIYNGDTMTIDGTTIVGNSADVPTQSTRAVLYSAWGEAGATATLNFAAGVSLDVNVDRRAAVIDINAAALGDNESGVTVVWQDGVTTTDASAVYSDANDTLTITYGPDNTLDQIIAEIDALDEFTAALESGVGGDTFNNRARAQTADQTTGIDSLTITAATGGPDFNHVDVGVVTRAGLGAANATATYSSDTKRLVITIDAEAATDLSVIEAAVDGLAEFSAVRTEGGTGRIEGGGNPDPRAIANTGISGYLRSTFSPGTHATATLDFLAGTALSIVGNGGISVIDINATALGTRESNTMASFVDDVTAGNESAVYNSQAKTLSLHYQATVSAVNSLINAIDGLPEFSATLLSGDAGDTLSAPWQQTGGGSAEATGVDSLKITALTVGADYNHLAIGVATQSGLGADNPTAVYDAAANTLVVTLDDAQPTNLVTIDAAIDALPQFSSDHTAAGTSRVKGAGPDADATANTDTTGGNLLLDDVEVAIGGNRGYELFYFLRNDSVNQWVEAINRATDATGVAASRTAGLLTLNSLTYGRDATVSATVVDGEFKMVDANGDVTDRSRGTGPNAGLGGQSGGGIYSAGPLQIAEATIRGNSAGIDGGGIYNRHSSVLTLADTSIAENRAASDGGGVYSSGRLNVADSTVAGNSADNSGGGIFGSRSTLTVTNSTITQNSAGYSGGGISEDRGTVTVTNSTIAGNSADRHGGGFAGHGTWTLTNSIVAQNVASTDPDVRGPLADGSGYNLIGIWSDGTPAPPNSLVGTPQEPLDPRLGPLGDYGGATWTMSLLGDSPAIDAGDPNPVDPLATDQRGSERIVDGDGDTVARIDMGAFEYLPGEVLVFGRHVFYNNSSFDGNDPAAGEADDAAIADDKRALLPGQTAVFANYTSYRGGINGVMVDIIGLAAAPTVEDFEFHVGNDDDPAGWTPVADEPAISVRPGEGIGGSDRVTIIWADNAIQKQWLQVTVRQGGNIGLSQPDVFYYGNAIGESGNSTTDAKVNVADMLAVRDNQRNFLDPAPVDFGFDYDRDARVDIVDMLIARENLTHFLNALQLIRVPPAMAAEGINDEAQMANDEQASSSLAIRVSGFLNGLHEFDRNSAQNRRSGQDDPTRQAVDRLLATWGHD